MLNAHSYLPRQHRTGNKVSHLRLPCCTINLTHGISDILLDVQNMGKMVKRQPVSEMALFLSGRKKVAHTRLPSEGSGADPGSWQSVCR